jgi:NAD(P)-dependent dehydrogenase (short-subunit alcohol dehydrogenase family)
MTYPDLAGRAALVTGGNSGIGAGCVERLAAEGMRVAFTGRDAARGAVVASRTGATFVRCDYLDRASADAGLAEATAALGGRIDLLVANAGMLLAGDITSTPDQAARELLEVNLTAVFRTCRDVYRGMRDAGGGSIVVMGSDTSIRGIHEISWYSVTKAAVAALAEVLAAEGAPHRVRVNAVCPGDVVPGVQATPTGFESHAEDPSGWTLPPSGRFGTAQDVAGLVAYLAADESSHVSGATLRIDGGAGAALRALTRPE